MPSIRCSSVELGTCLTAVNIAASPKIACGWRTRPKTCKTKQAYWDMAQEWFKLAMKADAPEDANGGNGKGLIS
jgi:hypothetical protein